MRNDNTRNGNNNRNNRSNYNSVPMINTMSGDKPDELIYVFHPNKQKVKSAIQKMFNKLTDGLREVRKWDIDDVKVNLGETRMGRYVMFTLTLPMSVLVGEKDKGNDIPEIFRPQSDSGIPPLKQPFHLLLKSLVYDADERKAFSTNKMRRELGATQSQMAAIKSVLTPRIQKMKNSNGKWEKYVVICVDPLKVFHAMYTEVNEDGSTKENAKQFECIVKSFKKIDSGNYMFTIYRVLKHTRTEQVPDMDLDEYFKKEIGMKSYHHGNK